MRPMHLLATLLLTQINPAFQDSGSISGRILNMNGEAAANVRVTVVQVPDGPAPSAGVTLVSLTLTGADGRYRLDNVPAGRYYIAVGRVERPTYFPGVGRLEDATAVALRTGERGSGGAAEALSRPPIGA